MTTKQRCWFVVLPTSCRRRCHESQCPGRLSRQQGCAPPRDSEHLYQHLCYEKERIRIKDRIKKVKAGEMNCSVMCKGMAERGRGAGVWFSIHNVVFLAVSVTTLAFHQIVLVGYEYRVQGVYRVLPRVSLHNAKSRVMESMEFQTILGWNGIGIPRFHGIPNRSVGQIPKP